MKHLIPTKSLLSVAVALGALAATSSAQARSEVHFYIGLPVPGIYVQPAPVSMYVQPRLIYTPMPGHHGRFDDGRRHNGRHWQSRGPYGDFDRDGIMNRQDRDRDGDGVRNRYDRLPDNPYRR